jgi:hypothetical protein
MAVLLCTHYSVNIFFKHTLEYTLHSITRELNMAIQT